MAKLSLALFFRQERIAVIVGSLFFGPEHFGNTAMIFNRCDSSVHPKPKEFKDGSLIISSYIHACTHCL